MRPNNPNKRLRGRNRSKNSNPLARSYESNGPDVKIRGSALQVADKYAQLARDAQSAGDRVMAENYFQHAEHYYRIVAAAYEQQQPRDRRDEQQDRSARFDDRNEQPVINGYDGVDEEGDGVRRTLKVPNGADHHDGDDEEDGAVTSCTNGMNGSHHHAAAAETDESADGSARQADDGDEESHRQQADDSGGEEAPKPKRRTRATRSRSRSRKTEAAGEGQAPAADAEPAESTS